MCRKPLHFFPILPWWGAFVLRFAVIVFAGLLPGPDLLAAAADYPSLVADIQARLDKTSALYAQDQTDAARTEVQMAYFEVFENLEGPIRINLSAQKSYRLESAFGEIRRLIGQGHPKAGVAAKIDDLKKELTAVLPALLDGHRLTAEESHSTATDDQVAPIWKEAHRLIDDRLAEAIGLVQAGQADGAVRRVQQAWYDGFKNSELEIVVRRHRSVRQAADINARFSRLIVLARAGDALTEFGYQTTTLLQDIAELLPGLPLFREPDPERTAAASAPEADWSQVARQIDDAVAAAIARYRDGDARAAMLAVQDAYFDLFESSGMEARLGARDAAAKTTLEGHFTRLVGLAKAGRPATELEAQARFLHDDLARAAASLGKGRQTFAETFLYSFLILFREGLEALLIVAAIVAYLVKNGHADKLPLIRNSVVVALLASLVTAGLFQWIFARSGASRELLEGITMLVAVVVLFGMSYWLLSKAEARQWKAYLEGKLASSLGKGSLAGLWFASFLAVYREGAETVLFYFALAGDAGGARGLPALISGFAAGAALLAGVYVVMRFTVVRLPLRPFFTVTGFFLYGMAFVFAGKGVLELIEGKLFEPTLVPHVPEIAWLGIHPYRETLLPQAVLLLAALAALWTLRRPSRSPADSPAPRVCGGEARHM